MKRNTDFLEILLKIMTHILAASIGAAIAVMLFIWTGTTVKDPGLTKLEELQALIEERFIGEADATAMGDAAAVAMIDSLGDRWSYYISAAEYESYMEQMKNAYVGVGITVTLREDGTGADVIQDRHCSCLHHLLGVRCIAPVARQKRRDCFPVM